MRLSTYFKWVLVVLLSGAFYEDAFSQILRGCRSGGFIYRNSPTGLYGWTGAVSETCPPNATTATQYARFVQNATNSPSCPINLLSLGGSGTLVDYRLLNCPIDDWLQLLFFPLALAGMMAINKLRTN